MCSSGFVAMRLCDFPLVCALVSVAGACISSVSSIFTFVLSTQRQEQKPSPNFSCFLPSRLHADDNEMLRRKPSNASEKEQVQKKKLTLQRSSSFKDFMKPKVTSPVMPDKEFVLDETVEESVTEGGKSGGKLSKKWRYVISRTITRKNSKMVQKVLAEEGPLQGESSEELMSPKWGGQRMSTSSTGSEETVSSPVTCPFSGNSDRQSLDSGYCQRDSMKLEENAVSFDGPFCGRAVVHTDFTPSPYDVESLKLQKGDIIHIIDKPPVGTWTGKLHHKVGSFKFIYINLLPDESPPVRRRRCDSKTNRNKSKPSTLEEVLDCIGLMELSSLLSMHGFQNLEDFTGLRESHLNELNITDPDQRAKILSVADLLRDQDESSPQEEDEEEEEVETRPKEPRDSGCFDSSEQLDVKPEEAQPQREPQDDWSETSKETEQKVIDDVQQYLQELSVQEAY
ncbi:SAM and SH3 domain-containing protein 3 isoform X2 [Hippocampus comes]|uniref:SAM and SH3 domain-containing protein 3 isoform X2 n=1 Tax=Hippocampus comes TaxID=109280 RepID=UPI00094E7AB1|nr:PREDICTED: SAM and SH3 domain-containing protein 3 isoform X2 [Hippocampus comes]